MRKEYYIEFVLTKSQKPYEMQSRSFKTQRAALKWLNTSFDFLSHDVVVDLMVISYSDDELEYEINKLRQVFPEN